MSAPILTTQQDTCDHAGFPMPNLELEGYAHAFRKWLESANTFLEFKLYITKELQRLGFSDWSYERLDIPPAARIPVGTFQHNEYYNHTLGPDLMAEHIATTADKSPVFRSTIEQYIQQIPISIALPNQAQELFDYYARLGYHDCVGIPLSCGEQGNHALFTLAANGEDADYIKQTFLSCDSKVKIIAEIVEDIGNDRYPEFFIGVKEKYDRLTASGPLKLLVAMIEHDCGIPQAAKKVGISRAAADKQLARIRNWLNARTTHTAVLNAIKLGVITCNTSLKPKE